MLLEMGVRIQLLRINIATRQCFRPLRSCSRPPLRSAPQPQRLFPPLLRSRPRRPRLPLAHLTERPFRRPVLTSTGLQPVNKCWALQSTPMPSWPGARTACVHQRRPRSANSSSPARSPPTWCRSIAQPWSVQDIWVVQGLPIQGWPMRRWPIPCGRHALFACARLR